MSILTSPTTSTSSLNYLIASPNEQLRIQSQTLKFSKQIRLQQLRLQEKEISKKKLELYRLNKKNIIEKDIDNSKIIFEENKKYHIQKLEEEKNIRLKHIGQSHNNAIETTEQLKSDANASNKLWNHLDEIDNIRYTSELEIIQQINTEKRQKFDSILGRREEAKLLSIEHLQKLKALHPYVEPEVEILVEKPADTKFFVEKHSISSKSNAALALSNPVSFKSISPVIKVYSQATAFEHAEEIKRQKSLKHVPNNKTEIERTKAAYEKVNRQKACVKISDSLEAELKEQKSNQIFQPIISRPIPLSTTGALKDQIYFDKQKQLEKAFENKFPSMFPSMFIGNSSKENDNPNNITSNNNSEDEDDKDLNISNSYNDHVNVPILKPRDNFADVNQSLLLKNSNIDNVDSLLRLYSESPYVPKSKPAFNSPISSYATKNLSVNSTNHLDSSKTPKPIFSPQISIVNKSPYISNEETPLKLKISNEIDEQIKRMKSVFDVDIPDISLGNETYSISQINEHGISNISHGNETSNILLFNEHDSSVNASTEKKFELDQMQNFSNTSYFDNTSNASIIKNSQNSLHDDHPLYNIDNSMDQSFQDSIKSTENANSDYSQSQAFESVRSQLFKLINEADAINATLGGLKKKDLNKKILLNPAPIECDSPISRPLSAKREPSSIIEIKSSCFGDDRESWESNIVKPQIQSNIVSSPEPQTLSKSSNLTFQELSDLVDQFSNKINSKLPVSTLNDKPLTETKVVPNDAVNTPVKLYESTPAFKVEIEPNSNNIHSYQQYINIVEDSIDEEKELKSREINNIDESKRDESLENILSNSSRSMEKSSSSSLNTSLQRSYAQFLKAKMNRSLNKSQNESFSTPSRSNKTHVIISSKSKNSNTPSILSPIFESPFLKPHLSAKKV